MTKNEGIKPKFSFWEIVTVITNKYVDIPMGSQGYIIAMDEEPQLINGYDIFLFDLEEVRGFYDGDLKSTNKFVSREYHFSGESIKVGVNEKGEGFLKD